MHVIDKFNMTKAYCDTLVNYPDSHGERFSSLCTSLFSQIMVRGVVVSVRGWPARLAEWGDSADLPESLRLATSTSSAKIRVCMF